MSRAARRVAAAHRAAASWLAPDQNGNDGPRTRVERDHRCPSVVLRCVNVTGVAMRGRWRLGFPVKHATLARLDETPLGDALPIEHDAGAPVIAFEAGPRAVVTILVRS